MAVEPGTNGALNKERDPEKHDLANEDLRPIVDVDHESIYSRSKRKGWRDEQFVKDEATGDTATQTRRLGGLRKKTAYTEKADGFNRLAESSTRTLFWRETQKYRRDGGISTQHGFKLLSFTINRNDQGKLSFGGFKIGPLSVERYNGRSKSFSLKIGPFGYDKARDPLGDGTFLSKSQIVIPKLYRSFTMEENGKEVFKEKRYLGRTHTEMEWPDSKGMGIGRMKFITKGESLDNIPEKDRRDFIKEQIAKGVVRRFVEEDSFGNVITDYRKSNLRLRRDNFRAEPGGIKAESSQRYAGLAKDENIRVTTARGNDADSAKMIEEARKAVPVTKLTKELGARLNERGRETGLSR